MSNLTSAKLKELLSLAPASLSQYEFNTFIVNENIGRARQFRAVIEQIITLEARIDIEKFSLAENFDVSQFAVEIGLRIAKLEQELEVHKKWISQFSETEIETALRKFEDTEPEYWVHAVGTQAALDILTVGKMSTEIMRKMMLMKREDFFKTVVVATKIAQQVQGMTAEAEKSMEGAIRK